MAEGHESPYMLFVAPLKHARRLDTTDAEAATLTGLAQLDVPRSEVPAVTHVDFSARVQSVDAARYERYHALLRRFEAKTGCPLLINTSFNVRGEPIVCSPKDAYRCFMATEMDVLVLEHCVLHKSAQPLANAAEASDHQSQFALD
jgi:carbamoyltransferase